MGHLFLAMIRMSKYREVTKFSGRNLIGKEENN